MKRILIVAGETSGDLHGSALIRRMKEMSPDIEFKGIGGTQMIAEGLETIRHVREMNFMGLVEVVKHLPFIRKTLKELEYLLETWHPDLVILIDYPGFNLKFAPSVKKYNTPLMYYISPQLWAWHKSRVKLIREYVDKIVVLFDFEVDFYRKYGVKADFFGHPLLDIVFPSQDRESFRVSVDATNKPLIGFLPGSRPQEIERILPAMIGSLHELKERLGPFTAVIGCAPELDEKILDKYIEGKDVRVLRGKTYDIMAHADVIVVSSGTATLETGILGTPMVIVYRTSFLTYLIGKSLVSIRNIGLINIVAGSRVVPELWQNDVTPKKIADYVLNMLQDKEIYERTKILLHDAKENLGEPGASLRTAKLAVEMLKN